MMCEFDSTGDTLKHSQYVGELMMEVINELGVRSTCHDRSKTEEPELSCFNEFTPKLRDTEFGTPEYKACTDAMDVALQHHYKENRHHPQHFENGINDMTLADLVEMLADWKAATIRNKNGDLMKSFDFLRDRFGISPQLEQIMKNTALHFGWVEGVLNQEKETK
jgi:hypothetical protein